ncbi:hypothetical protein DFH11DRAFT_934703 [Phellopilus nigrolimitatus]|nr:hypothetical protein DFH11DRAFT_934703 [Phellopilus nigrolimitatus]
MKVLKTVIKHFGMRVHTGFGLGYMRRCVFGRCIIALALLVASVIACVVERVDILLSKCFAFNLQATNTKNERKPTFWCSFRFSSPVMRSLPVPLSCGSRLIVPLTSSFKPCNLSPIVCQNHRSASQRVCTAGKACRTHRTVFLVVLGTGTVELAGVPLLGVATLGLHWRRVAGASARAAGGATLVLCGLDVALVLALLGCGAGGLGLAPGALAWGLGLRRCAGLRLGGILVVGRTVEFGDARLGVCRREAGLGVGRAGRVARLRAVRLRGVLERLLCCC